MKDDVKKRFGIERADDCVTSQSRQVRLIVDTVGHDVQRRVHDGLHWRQDFLVLMYCTDVNVDDAGARFELVGELVAGVGRTAEYHGGCPFVGVQDPLQGGGAVFPVDAV